MIRSVFSTCGSEQPLSSKVTSVLFSAAPSGVGQPHEVYRYQAGHGSLVVDETIRQVEAQLAFALRELGMEG